MTKSILGYEVESDTIKSCISDIANGLDGTAGACRWMACLNPHSYILAKTDARFRASLEQADWLVPDGFGIVIAGRILGRTLQERITGFDIFDGVMRKLNARGGSVFFLGSTVETLAMIERKLPRDYPNVRLAGVYSPAFKAEYTDADLDEMITAIASSGAEVLWVGMTAPKQEKWIAANKQRLDVRFVGAIGAVFDFYAGRVRRSNPIFQKLGLEWLPRLIQEPRRLWRRTFISAPMFLWDVCRERIRTF